MDNLHSQFSLLHKYLIFNYYSLELFIIITIVPFNYKILPSNFLTL